MLNVLADKYLYNIESHIPEHFNLRLYDPAQGLPKLDNVNALLIRTVNKINKKTLPKIPPALSFIGTASAGSDHVDIDYLHKQGIAFSTAAGCNARSVAEYVATSLLLWSESRKVELPELSVGIIGAGNVGTQVVKLLTNLGISYTAYDPPREIRDPDFNSASLEELLECDILSFHTPLTRQTDFPTYHWLDAQKLNGRRFKLILNTARGGVIDEDALLASLHNNTANDIIIDTWEDEPEFHLQTAEQAFIKTPHIAGYSEQAKDNATKIALHAMLKHFDISVKKASRQENGRILSQDISSFDSFSALLTELHPIKKYESELTEIIDTFPGERGTHFNKLRAEFPLRQEFAQIYLPKSYFARFPILKELGFSELTDK
jgi:erythronate-4-phosphate dehydrogenase